MQRDHASVENIVRMAMEAGPIIMVSEDSPPKLDAFDDPIKPPSTLALKEQESKAPSFESLILESSIAPVDAPAMSGTQEYVMSSAAATNVRLLTTYSLCIVIYISICTFTYSPLPMITSASNNSGRPSQCPMNL